MKEKEQLDKKEFTLKQVNILVFTVIVGIAFIETLGGAIWTIKFLKEFLLNIIVYSAVAAIIFVIFGEFYE